MIISNAHIKYILNGITAWLTLAMVISCTSDSYDDDRRELSHISLWVSAAGISINQDTQGWEDRVDELRMIAFDSQSGKRAFNEKLYFPNGLTDRSKPVAMRPGEYDFYFIANETVYNDEFVDALMHVTTKSDFDEDIRFKNLTYRSEFMPDSHTIAGRFLMSAIYKEISIVSGGTEEAPLQLPLPTPTVELIRSLAKVEIVFRKKDSGAAVSKESLQTVSLHNVASTLSVPPYDDYYQGATTSTNMADLSGLNFDEDHIGSVTFYIPEFLVPQDGTLYTILSIDNRTFPIQTDEVGISAQRRTLPALSSHSVIRNYHYTINAYISGEDGNEIEIRVYVKPWEKEEHTYILGGGSYVVLPPIYPTDSSVVMPTVCSEYIEILYRNETINLQSAYNYTVNWGGESFTQDSSPYYCEKKYGKGWRLIESCELMSYLAVLDIANNVWLSNTWDMDAYNQSNPQSPIPLYAMPMRKAAQRFLEKLTGTNLSDTKYVDETTANSWEKDQASSNKEMGLIGQYFIPGDILYKPSEFESGWTGSIEQQWFFYESAFQIPAIWWNGSAYITLALRENWDKVLYTHFRKFDFSGNSRCVRTVK